MSRVRAAFFAVSGAVAVTACSDSPSSVTPDAPVAARQVASPGLEKLAQEIPGFGGFYLDANGIPTVYMTDPLRRGAAENALGPMMRAMGRPSSDINVRRGEFVYGDLHQWYQASSVEALGLAGAVYVDLDEASNRVRVGVERGASQGAIRAAVARAGVPANAVIFTEVEPVQQMATLRDQIRPVQGGLQIHFTQFLCTLGFNAVSGTTASFITNSHCTATQGGVEDTQYFQPTSSAPNSFIATEVADPEYSRRLAGCPKGKKCRFSDSSRAAYAAGVSSSLGVLARTTGPNNGSLEIAGTFTITGENNSSSIPVGTVLNKVGRTTGWTQGQVTQTCVNTSVSGSNIAQLCQTFVAAGVGSGDSGSPVFSVSGTNATLVGILWGGSGSSLFVFSPLANIEQELGALRTF